MLESPDPFPSVEGGVRLRQTSTCVGLSTTIALHAKKRLISEGSSFSDTSARKKSDLAEITAYQREKQAGSSTMFRDSTVNY